MEDWADLKANELYNGIVAGKLDREGLAVILRLMQSKAAIAAFEETRDILKATFDRHSVGGGDK